MIEYLFGDDTVTARKSIHERSEALRARIRWISQEDVVQESVESLFDAGKGSLLGSVLVVLEDPSSYPEEVREHILAQCEGAYSGNVLLWDRAVDKRLAFHKQLKKAVKFEVFDQPKDEPSMLAWLRSYAPELSTPVAKRLLIHVGLDVPALMQEIEKLRALGTPIQESDVERIVPIREMGYDNAFPLLDAIVHKQRDRAVEILEQLLSSGSSERFVLSMLAYQFRLFLAIRAGKDNGDSVSDIQQKTGFHSIAIQKAAPIATRLSVSAISDLLARIAATEKSLVTTTMDARSIVTMLVVGLSS